jgi:hypothetical protein
VENTAKVSLLDARMSLLAKQAAEICHKLSCRQACSNMNVNGLPVSRGAR